MEGNAHGPIFLPSVTEREAGGPAQRDLRRSSSKCAELGGQTAAEGTLTSSPSQEACARKAIRRSIQVKFGVIREELSRSEPGRKVSTL